MVNNTTKEFISSKEILEKTGISRATLNNYIKMGMIPRPVVRRPVDEAKSIKRLGYFPFHVLDSIERVKYLKKQGKSIEEIVSQTKQSPCNKNYDSGNLAGDEFEKNTQKDKTQGTWFNFEDITFPSYFLSYDFFLIWINHEAEQKILNQKFRDLNETGLVNIFRIFFNTEFQSSIKNWKDLVAYHVSFIKIRFSKMWLPKLFKGFNQSELSLLQALYDDVSPSSTETIQDNLVKIQIQDSSTRQYCVYTILLPEGMLFSYRPELGN